MEGLMKRTAVLTLILLSGMTARADVAQTTAAQPMLFVADLAGKNVAPAAVDTAATGKATAVLVGSRFIVHGSFTGLSSELRDIAKTPNDPGVHLHPGAAGEVNKYFHGLQVRLNADQRSGIFFGETTLNEELRARLLDARLYIDVHTVKNGPGEIRDQWRAAEPGKAKELLALLGGHMTATTSAGACH
jgi:hypothetical protein